ncbi:MAG: thiamine phosphate synthase [Campylobacterales bacterium]|nr:thiamine phosphate synthase [Campylobacterales bacterium]
MIYALIDKQSLIQKNIDLSSLLHVLKKINPPILQYRNKNEQLEAIKSDLANIRADFQGKIIINDHIELIDLADGVHLGQEDIRIIHSDIQEAVKIIRDKIEKKLFGLSTHNLAEIKEANTLDIDYIGLGAYRLSGTKSDAKVYGEGLLEIAKSSKHPVALIGGVKLDDNFDSIITYSVIGSDLFTLL